MPDARSLEYQAGYAACCADMADLCGLEYVSADETDGSLGDDDRAHNAGVANCIGMIRAAASRAVPEGYRLVPVEPTEAMIDAAFSATVWPDLTRAVPSVVKDGLRLNMAKEYRAMLAAVKP